MAAAAIPILSVALPLLTPLIMSLVTHVEKLFGPKTGSTKFDTVLKALSPIINNLLTAGVIKGPLDETNVATIIETIVQQLKTGGQLDTLPPVPGNSMTILGGNLIIK